MRVSLSPQPSAAQRDIQRVRGARQPQHSDRAAHGAAAPPGQLAREPPGEAQARAAAHRGEERAQEAEVLALVRRVPQRDSQSMYIFDLNCFVCAFCS